MKPKKKLNKKMSKQNAIKSWQKKTGSKKGQRKGKIDSEQGRNSIFLGTGSIKIKKITKKQSKSALLENYSPDHSFSNSLKYG